MYVSGLMYVMYLREKLMEKESEILGVLILVYIKSGGTAQNA